MMPPNQPNRLKRLRRYDSLAEFLPPSFVTVGLFIYSLRVDGLALQLVGIVLIFLGIYAAYETQAEEAKKELLYLFMKLLLTSVMGAIAYGSIAEAQQTMHARDCSWGGYLLALALFALAALMIPGVLMTASMTSKELGKNAGKDDGGPCV